MIPATPADYAPAASLPPPADAPPTPARSLWEALDALSLAQQTAILTEDADGLDALLDQKALLLSELSARDTARDVAGDPSLVALMLAAQGHEDEAEAAFHAAQARMAQRMAALRVRRAARAAFQNGNAAATAAAGIGTAAAPPAFVDCQR